MNKFVGTPAPLESFLSGSSGVWGVLQPDQRQVTARRKLRADLDQFNSEIPVYEDLYPSLCELLASGDNDRFVLYCPLELIPKGSWYRRYHNSVDDFAELFLQSWRRLLCECDDVRADFIDGDIPDIEDDMFSDRICQAACLVPVLMTKGLLRLECLTHAERQQIHDSVLPYPHSHSNPRTDYRGAIENSDFVQLVKEALFKCEMNLQLIEASKKRVNWLRSHYRRKIIENIAFSAAHSIGAIDKILKYPLDVDSSAVIVASIRFAIEQADCEEFQGVRLYRKYEGKLTEFAQDDRLRGEITKCFCRLHSIGIVDQEKLKELNIFLPNLAGPFYSNLTPIEDNRQAVMEKLKDPELQQVIYPVAILFGSTLKGYASQDADIDRAVFVRPGLTDREGVRKLIRSKLGDVVEYWLDENEAGLRIHDFPKLEAYTGDSTNAHVLFGGVWDGEQQTIAMLAEKLLKPYLLPHRLRWFWLREIERDVLQYRLLHRGYEMFHVPKIKDRRLFPEIWWDEGYRWMAAKLYASHVFLPFSTTK